MNKVILITGCSSGLGKVLIEVLSVSHNVYATARNIEDLKQWRAQKNIHTLSLDITKDEDCQRVVRYIQRKEGRIDCLINNAGYTLVGSTEQFNSQQFLNILNTNCVGAFRLIKEVVPYMKSQKSGRIINITSLNGLVAFPNFGLYGASKFALEALGRSLHFELKKFGILVTNVAPGAIALEDSKITKKLPHIPAREKIFFLKLLMPMIKGQQVAEAVVHLIEGNDERISIVMGRDAKVVNLLNSHMSRLLNRAIQRIWDK